VRPAVSAGILLYRRRGGHLQVLLAHPGGPFWAGRDAGAWTIPKGIAEGAEELAAVALREFAEETGFDVTSIALDPGRAPLGLGEVTLKSGKVVHGWAVEGDLDPELAHSNDAQIEWPPRTGRRMLVPEVDRVAWFEPVEARRRLHPAQAAFVDRLEREVG
jgi:predicted NUDIX family NTP pyrophosphohydrolase